MKKYPFVLVFMLLLSTSSFAQGLFSSIFGSPQKGRTDLRVEVIDGDDQAKEEIFLIKIHGIIQQSLDSESFSLSIERNIMDQVRRDLRVAKLRNQVKAVLIEIDSPGGEVTASDILHNWITRFKEDTKKPVVAIIGSTGTSGAYYTACAADKIIAHPTSLTGSIGGIIQSINIERLVKNIGIEPITIKSERTPNKDILSPFKTLSEQEKEMLRSIIDEIYERFVKIVAQSRNMEVEEVYTIAHGGIYTASTALEKGLIDQIGYREDAIALLCEMAEIETAALVQRKRSKSIRDIITGIGVMSSGAPYIRNELKRLLETSGQIKLLYQTSP